MAPCELVVFDWDGTLMDSAARIVESVRAAIDASGLEPRTDAQIREIIGLGVPEAIAALYPDTAASARARLANSYRETFVRTVSERPAVLFAGVEETLDELEAAGYLLAVATGKSRAGLRRDLQHAGLEGRFAATRTVDECRSKPDPDMLHDLLGEFGLAPDAAVMVGDTLFDLEMARSARVPALAVSWGVHEPYRLLAAQPERLLVTMDELPMWMRQREAHPDADSTLRRRPNGGN